MLDEFKPVSASGFTRKVRGYSPEGGNAYPAAHVFVRHPSSRQGACRAVAGIFIAFAVGEKRGRCVSLQL